MKLLAINIDRLLTTIEQLSQCGALPGGGNNRLALSDEDKAGRDLVCGWMAELKLEIVIDRIGNVIARRPGRELLAPVMLGSHIDTVATGGIYDGNLGVLAGLEVVRVLNEQSVSTRRPLAVAFFTNEEGVRFTPDMMGSQVYAGALDAETALAEQGIDGCLLAEELERIAYAGSAAVGRPEVFAYLELHIEQGPVLDRSPATIGVVEQVQGISWTQLEIHGQSNHAGTTPMDMRCDAGHAASLINCFVNELADRMGGNQVATVGRIEFHPNLINVIPASAVMTVDLRNTDTDALGAAEQEFMAYLEHVAQKYGLRIEHKSLARFEPVQFDPEMVDLVESVSRDLGLSTRRMASGAGHDAQMLAAVCPSSMIFVPSVKGISHNVTEFTEAADIEAGANVLLNAALQLCER